MRRSRISRYVPGASRGRSPWLAVVLSTCFYAYCATLIGRAGALIVLFRSPSPRSTLDASAALLGLLVFYFAAILPALVDERASGKVFADRCRRFWAHKAAVAGLVACLVFLAVSLLAPLIVAYDPSVQTSPATERYRPPSQSHPMGTDKFGRDVLSRVIYGSRVSLGIGIFAVLLAALLGTVVGAFSGYVGGRADDAAMRIVDGFLAFPRLLLIVTLVAFFANSFWLVVLALALTGWMGFARLVRADVLALKEREFVQAAVASGVGHAGIVWRHLIPNALGTVVVAATLRFALLILLESYLSFLGLGVQPPTPSWGSMVFEGREVIVSAWWVSGFPGLALALAVVSWNLVGDGLRDSLDVRMG